MTAAGQLEAGQLEAGQLDAGQPGAIQSGAILAHLREATRPAHQALDVALGLMDDGIGIAAYTRLLERFYGFWCGWQPQMAGLMRDEALLGPRRRLHLLAADLAALGLSPDAVRALPWCPLPALRDASEALGSLYVMEGSTLGGASSCAMSGTAWASTAMPGAPTSPATGRRQVRCGGRSCCGWTPPTCSMPDASPPAPRRLSGVLGNG